MVIGQKRRELPAGRHQFPRDRPTRYPRRGGKARALNAFCRRRSSSEAVLPGRHLDLRDAGHSRPKPRNEEEGVWNQQLGTSSGQTPLKIVSKQKCKSLILIGDQNARYRQNQFGPPAPGATCSRSGGTGAGGPKFSSSGVAQQGHVTFLSSNPEFAYSTPVYRYAPRWRTRNRRRSGR